MSFAANPLFGRLRITDFTTVHEIIAPVPSPIEITLILCPTGGIAVYHRRSGEANFGPENQIIGTDTGNIVFQSTHIGSGITLGKGDSLGVFSSAAETVSVYAAISVVEEEIF